VFKIVDGPIENIQLEEAVRTEADGAVIVFRGVARRFSRGRDVVWSHPAFANGCIFVRNDREIVCLSLKA